MFSDQGQGTWPLERTRKMLWVRLSSNRKACRIRAMFDTGAERCVFPSNMEEILFSDCSKGKIVELTGIGGSVKAVARVVTVEVFSDDQMESLICVEKVRVFFVREKEFRLALLGVVGFMDKFQWALNYPSKVLVAK